MKKILCITLIIVGLNTITAGEKVERVIELKGVEIGRELEKEMEESVEVIDEYIYAMEGMMC